MIFVEDLTDRKIAEEQQRLLHAEREVHEALQIEAQRISQAKDRFFATLSHELRTPLNSILGWVYIAKRSDFEPEKTRQAIQLIEQSARAQAQLISDILDINRISTGRIPLEKTEISLQGLLRTSIEQSRPAAQAKNLSLDLTTCPETATVLGDPTRLHQCLWNIITNAVKFSPPGGHINLSASVAGGSVEILVQDTGIGIKVEVLPRIFEHFVQGDSSSTRAHGGLGLGLAITKHLIEMHGGTIHATSEGKNLGSLFTITLPLAPTSENQQNLTKAATPAQAHSLHGATILVIDDHDNSRVVLHRILEDARATVISVTSADEGLKSVAAHTPDIILCDLSMPHRDGYYFIQQLRSLGVVTPTIAVSANTFPADVERTKRAGFDLHLPKPIDPDVLLEQLAVLLSLA
jgi:CheY-like chemotaxis protein